MKRIYLVIILVLSGVMFVGLNAGSAQHDKGGPPLAIAGEEPAAGKSFWVGFHALTPPGSNYTFWPQGHEAPQINWDLPEGFTLGMTRWPTFENLASEGAPRFGFKAGTIIWKQIKVPENWDGSPFHIGLKVAYYVCQIDCEQIFEAAQLNFGGDEAPENLGPLPDNSFTLGPLAIHANVGTNGDFLLGVNFRYENLTDQVKAVYFLPTVAGLLLEGPPLQLAQSEKKFYQQAFRGYLGITPHAEGAKEISRITGVIVFEMADGSGFQGTSFRRMNDYREIVALGMEPDTLQSEFTLLTAFLFALLGGG